ncbi:MAG TPA: N-acyl homoserine lactonase family protein [Gemmatimonadaceae bacterium]|nr:N-acyl homoserine lactonase family protein [Gemmatimonadaceae bacterium]
MRLLPALFCGLAAFAPTSAPSYEVYAVRFAGYHGYPLAALVAGADTTRRQDLAFMVWLMKGPNGRNVLLDAGFYREKVQRGWSLTDFEKPSTAVAKLGVRPEDVTDIIISHVHWDHLDGADLFPNAHVWIQRDEYRHYVGADGQPLDRAIDTVDADMLAHLYRAGRVTLVDGDAREIIPGITVYTGGRHTFASQYVGVVTGAGTVVLASDNAYLYANLATHTAVGATFSPGDTTMNRKAQERMERIATSPRLIVPGHDPDIFIRFPAPGNGVARIQ